MQNVLKELKTNPTTPLLCIIASAEPAQETFLHDYAGALTTDPVSCTRTLVSTCRASGQRRRDLKASIVEGNSKGIFRDEAGSVLKLPVLELLRDADMCWSSTFNMIGHVITLYLVCKNPPDLL